MKILVDSIIIIFDLTAWASLMSFLFCPAIVFNRKYGICIGGTILLTACLKYVDPSGTLSLIPFLLFPLLLILAFEKTDRRKKFGRSMSILLLLLILGMIPGLLLSSTNINPEPLTNVVFLAADVTIIWICRRNYDKASDGVKFTAFDLLACLILSLFNLVIMVLIKTPAEFGIGPASTLSPLLNLIIGITILLDIFFLFAFIKNKTSAYYRTTNQVNLQYMANELKHFQAYRDSQLEIRRYRHDMKNHFLCLQALCREQKFEALSSYIDTLFASWQETGPVYHTGDDIVDSILNGKAQMLAEQQIRLEVSGHFGNALRLSPLDICTIFANAIDNAMEANVKIAAPQERFLQIQIRSNQNFYLIAFRNPIASPITVDRSMIIPSSKKGANHGFGLRNMKLAAKKYQGHLTVDINDHIFSLEIILPHNGY